MIDINSRILSIGNDTGIQLNFFKLNENPVIGVADGMSALYDRPYAALRVFCLIIEGVLVVFGGGEKPDGITSWQSSPILKPEGDFSINVIELIKQRIDEGTLFIDEGIKFTGNLIIN